MCKASWRRTAVGSCLMSPSEFLSSTWSSMLRSPRGKISNLKNLGSVLNFRLTERSLVSAESLTKLRESQAKLGEALLGFIREQTDDYTPYIKAMIDEAEVPLPTRPVWFDGRKICPLGLVFNK